MSVEDPIDDIRAKVKKEYAELWDTEEFQEALEEYGNAFLLFLYGTWAASYNSNVDELISVFGEAGILLFDSEKAWAEDMADRLGLYGALEESNSYSQYFIFDWEQLVYDTKCEGSFTFWDTEDGVYVQPNF